MSHKKLFKLQVITPERIIYDANVYVVVVPGREGILAILFGHEPIIASLSPGIIIIENQDLKKIEVIGGVVSAKFDSCIIITNSAKFIDG